MNELPLVGEKVVVRAAIAPMHEEPRVSSPQSSQRVSGQILDVLELRDAWLHVRGSDSYDGWVHRGYLDGLPRFEPDREEILYSLGCVVEQQGGGRRALPLGARLWPAELVVDGDVVSERERPDRFPRTRARLAGSARTLYAGAPYQWGGITTWGADCSGFVQSICDLHGILLPRDAWQQALVSGEHATDLALFDEGDLLFFSDRSDRRITHVGIALGARAMAHSALGRGGNCVDVLEEGDPYVESLLSRFVTGMRLSGWIEEGD